MPEVYEVHLMPEASADLIAIHDFIEKASSQNATSVVKGLFEAIDSLELFPHRYKVHRSNQEVNRIVRSMPVPPFIVFYRIRETDRIVEILTVRHGARMR
jgi:plasmid stabilization system protein ParE